MTSQPTTGRDADEGVPILDPAVDSCPCGGSKRAIDCCISEDGQLRSPPDARTTPPSPKTGYSHPRCYAQTLADCSTKITKEHFISEKILLRIQGDGLVTASGFPFLGGKAKDVSAASLAPRVLCKRHNEALSKLDDVAIRFFACLTDFATELGEEAGAAKSRVVLLNGHDMERWCLKLLCGGARSGMLSTQGFRGKDWLPSEEWLEVLFGERRIPHPQGLYFTSPGNAVIAPRDMVGLQPLFANGMPRGMKLGLSGLDFVFLASTTIDINWIPNEGALRLHDLRVGWGRVEKILATRWRPGEASPTTIHVVCLPPGFLAKALGGAAP